MARAGSLEVTPLLANLQRKGTGSGLKTRPSRKGSVTCLNSATYWETVFKYMRLQDTNLVYTAAVTVTKALMCCENSGGAPTAADLRSDSGVHVESWVWLLMAARWCEGRHQVHL